MGDFHAADASSALIDAIDPSQTLHGTAMYADQARGGATGVN